VFSPLCNFPVILFFSLLIHCNVNCNIPSGDEEIVLYFYYPSAGKYYINAVYSRGTVFLPVTELFSILCVHCENGGRPGLLKGTWQGRDKKWYIDIDSLKAYTGEKEISFSKEVFRKGSIDIYLSPAIFERLFGLRFTINMSTLRLSLKSDRLLPVDEKELRDRRHFALEKRLSGNRYYPLLYPRERNLLNGGMVDYDIGISRINDSPSFNYNMTGGIELLGGDMRGSFSGSVTDEYTFFRMGSFNWRYVFRQNPYITSVEAGNLYTTGCLRRGISGISVTNEPVIPRKVFNTYVVEGDTDPGSEVELYINNRLAFFTEAGEKGHYRFNFPLTYGTVKLNLRIYKPSGEIIHKNKRLQIPFSLLPSGIISYNMQGGFINKGVCGADPDNYLLHFDIGRGISKNFTARVGADYSGKNLKPLVYLGFSGLIYDQYLINMDYGPGAFLRLGTRATYVSGSSLKFSYTRFDGTGMYNPLKTEQEINAGLYIPFVLSDIKSGIRLACDHADYIKGYNIRYRTGYSARINRYNFRVDYNAWLVERPGLMYNNSFLFALAGYSFPGLQRIPELLQGLFLTGRMQYDVAEGKIRSAGMQFSQSLCSRGHFAMNIDHDFIAGITSMQARLTFNLPSFRSTTRYSGYKGSSVFNQNFRGSFGFDCDSRKIVPSNRHQVRRAAVSVVMFIDSNGNGCFEKGETIVPSKALRLDQAADMKPGSKGILRITKLMSYRKYYAEIITEELPDPLLAPLFSKFSFVAGPNGFKHIEIPLYHTGIIEGKVTFCEEGLCRNIGGVRLIIRGLNKKFEKTIRTFSDGTFYCMGILPGHYTVEIDPLQLGLLNALSRPGRYRFRIKGSPEGDFAENLDFMITAIGD